MEPISDRKRRFQLSLLGNSQRNARREYLAALSPHLAPYLSECGYLPPDEYEEAASDFSISPVGIGADSRKPQDYWFREFSWTQKVVTAVRALDARHDEEAAYFLPHHLDNPIYCVRFGWVRANIAELLTPPNFSLGLIANAVSAGIVVSEYCGYLESDPNPDEVVYELAVWGYGEYEH